MRRLKQIIAFSVVISILAISICVLAAVPNPVPDTGQTQSFTNTFGEDSDYTTHPPLYTKLDAQGNPLLDTDPSWSMVKDNVTGLIWENKTDDGTIHDKDTSYTWDNVESDFITTLNTPPGFGGFTDWRLPTVKELSFIVNRGNSGTAINTAYFPNTISFYYWSSTTYPNSSSKAWCVSFGNSDVGPGSKSSGYYVRAVRSGQ